MDPSLLLITPARNEGAHLEVVARSVAAQTRRPDLWLVIDDGSDDGSLETIHRLEGELDFLRVLEAPQRSEAGAAVDRLAIAAEARAFNLALRSVEHRDFAFVGKLDADVELPPTWFAELLERVGADERLGIVGGRLVEPGRCGWGLVRIPGHHVHGAVKLYSRACFEAIGGIRECLGWDTIDETYARMHGFATRSFDDLVARHHRPSATAQGRLRGRARHGECAYIAGYSAWWVALRAAKVALSAPAGLSGLAFLGGYLRAVAERRPRVEDEDFRRFVRRELRERALRSLGLRGRAA